MEIKLKNIKTLAYWLGDQQKFYNKKIKCMKNENKMKTWEYFINSIKYKKYFLSNETKKFRDLKWENKLEMVKKYIDSNEKRPPSCDKNKDIRTLGMWISDQQKMYNKKIKCMKNEYIIKLWEDFVNSEKYKQYFLSNED